MSNSTTPKFSFNINELGEDCCIDDCVEFINVILQIANPKEYYTGLARYNHMKPEDVIDEQYKEIEEVKNKTLLDEIPERYWNEEKKEIILDLFKIKFFHVVIRGINKIRFVEDNGLSLDLTTFDKYSFYSVLSSFDCYECEFGKSLDELKIKKGSNLKIIFF